MNDENDWKRIKDVKTEKEIYIVGAGMDANGTLTVEAKSIIERAELLIGARRLIEMTETSLHEKKNRQVSITYRTEEIKELIDKTDKQCIVVLMSGDCGFFSGCTKLLMALHGQKVSVISGISSAVYFAGKLGEVWQDMHFVSLHGVKANVVSEVKTHQKSFFLMGGETDAGRLCRKLVEYGYGELRVCIGERLGMDGEQIRRGKASDYMEEQTDALCVVLVYNENPVENPAAGISDERFIRGRVPMTKAEIRAVILSKMNIRKRDICLDIGCGTGSVSVEMAGFASEGTVFAVDKEEEAVVLTGENSRKFGCDNIEVIGEEITKAIAQDIIPAPDRVFIGGSKGKMPVIFKWLRGQNKRCRIAVTAVSIETLSQAADCFWKNGIEPQIVEVAVTGTVRRGEYTMLQAQNPVFVLWGDVGEDNV